MLNVSFVANCGSIMLFELDRLRLSSGRMQKVAGNYDIAAVIAGEAVGLINDIPPAATIIERIVSEAHEITVQRHNSIDLGSSRAVR